MLLLKKQSPEVVLYFTKNSLLLNMAYQYLNRNQEM